MTPEEARDRFSEAYEGELDAEAQGAFEALLRASPELESEYEEFRKFMGRTRSLALEEPEPVNLVPGVQERIRLRSRHRFYRDRFASTLRPTWIFWMAIVLIVVLGGAWAALYYLEFQDPATPDETVDRPAPER